MSRTTASFLMLIAAAAASIATSYGNPSDKNRALTPAVLEPPGASARRRIRLKRDGRGFCVAAAPLRIDVDVQTPDGASCADGGAMSDGSTTDGGSTVPTGAHIEIRAEGTNLVQSADLCPGPPTSFWLQGGTCDFTILLTQPVWARARVTVTISVVDYPDFREDDS